MIRNIILLAFTLFLSFTSSAQMNVKIGYAANWINPEGNNSIYTQFNADRPWLDQELQNLKFLQGLVLGLRYTTEFDLGIELTYSNFFKRIISSGTDPGDNSSLYRRVNYNFNEVGFGLEYLFGNIGLGSSINADFLRTGIRKTAGANTTVISNQTVLSSSVYLSFHSAKNGVMSATIRPFVKIPWGNFDFTALSTELNGTTSQVTDDYMTFGLSLIFFNGN